MKLKTTQAVALYISASMAGLLRPMTPGEYMGFDGAMPDSQIAEYDGWVILVSDNEDKTDREIHFLRDDEYLVLRLQDYAHGF